VYLNRGEDDDALVAHMGDADKVGIDAPFGWPSEFVKAVVAHFGQNGWPGRGTDQRTFRDRLVFRETDRRMIEAKSRPLSVSTDRIGVTAMRCAHLLDRVAQDDGRPVDRVGRGKLVEVYPAAALRRWGFTATGYKRKAGLAALGVLIEDLERRAPWLEMSEGHRQLCRTSDDAFDALVAALVTRAGAIGLTELPLDELLPLAIAEGWIHLPNAGSFNRLPAP
jgi:hypothetical protein